MTMITPSAQLTLTKGNKSWSSTAVAAALELVDPPGCRNSHNRKKNAPLWADKIVGNWEGWKWSF